MKYLPKRTLLDDVLQVYYSIPCDCYANEFCDSCTSCKNRYICNMVENFINSLKKYY